MSERLASLLDEIKRTREKDEIALLELQVKVEIKDIEPRLKEAIDEYVEDELSGVGLAHFARVWINDSGEIVCAISFASHDLSGRPGFGQMCRDFEQNFPRTASGILEIPEKYITTTIY